MDEYDLIDKSSLKFKGQKKKSKKRDQTYELSRSKEDRAEGAASATTAGQVDDERSEDAEAHGNWWTVTRYEHIRDDVALEFLPGCYAKALSNGRIVLGQPHPPGDGPDEEEIFTALRAGTNQIALKSGFGRYLTIDKRKRLMGLSEAVGELEMFLPVFEDNKLALCAHNDNFLTPDTEATESQLIYARAERVGPNEILNIRVNNDPLFEERTKKAHTKHEVDLGRVLETEINNIRKAKKIESRISIEDEKERLKKARVEGQLHEALLDTRAKLKSDKYCK